MPGLSIATVSVSGTLPEKLAAIAAAGFDGVEIFEQDFLASDLTPEALGSMVRDHGLVVTLFQPFRDFEGLPEPHRARAFARAERKFDLMNRLGTDLMLVCSTLHSAALGGIDRMARDFRELGELAARHGVRVGFEALAWGRHIHDHRDAWEVVRRADHPQVGLILDSFHTLARKIDPDTIRAIPGDRIFFVQLADAPAIPMDLLYWSRHFRNMPGEGDLEVTGFLRAVVATGYAGPFSLEIFNDQFRAGLPRLVALDGHRSLIDALDRVRRAEPALDVALPAFPAPDTVEGVAFVEIATSEQEEPGLSAFLAAAGFAPIARHVSKPVTRWAQNGVSVLVNTSTSGFAATAYAAHGTCVSEIALLVPDATATAARAKALLIPLHDETRGPGELSIPAVRGHAGSVLRLVDDPARWAEVDFRAVAGSGPGAGLTRIDHIAQTMAHDEMLSWSLFYHALFDARRAPMVDVADPDGLVKSQAVQAGAMRITLNGAEARRTLAGRFVEDSLGSSVQHIAFATDDIFATAAALADRGFPVLQIGANYYPDAEARFGLDDGLIRRMQAANILYDEDGQGAFFQLYSQMRPEGLFFEFVQRIGHYNGYGAPNAPFRIAAQKRLMRAAGVPRA